MLIKGFVAPEPHSRLILDVKGFNCQCRHNCIYGSCWICNASGVDSVLRVMYTRSISFITSSKTSDEIPIKPLPFDYSC